MSIDFYPHADLVATSHVCSSPTPTSYWLCSGHHSTSLTIFGWCLRLTETQCAMQVVCKRRQPTWTHGIFPLLRRMQFQYLFNCEATISPFFQLPKKDHWFRTGVIHSWVNITGEGAYWPSIYSILYHKRSVNIYIYMTNMICWPSVLILSITNFNYMHLNVAEFEASQLATASLAGLVMDGRRNIQHRAYYLCFMQSAIKY